MCAVISRYDSEPARSAIRASSGDLALQRLDGEARLGIGSDPFGAPVLLELFQRTPCRVLLPRVDGRALSEAVFLHTGGGITGGDRLRYALSLGSGARVTGTTQAAEKVYRALDRRAMLSTRLTVGQGADLVWLPQEAILFDGARLKRRTEIVLAGDSTMLAMECLLLGRKHHGEILRSVDVLDSWSVRRAGKLIWADNFRLDGDVQEQLSGAALLGGQSAIATIVGQGPEITGALDPLREMLATGPLKGGATLVRDLLICRLAAKDGASLRGAVAPLLSLLRGMDQALPRVWLC